MTTITLPPEVEGPLREEAPKKGVSPERLAIDALRLRFAARAAPTDEHSSNSSRATFLEGYVGVVAGSTEAFSEHCGERFEAGLVEDASREKHR